MSFKFCVDCQRNTLIKVISLSWHYNVLDCWSCVTCLLYWLELCQGLSHFSAYESSIGNWKTEEWRFCWLIWVVVPFKNCASTHTQVPAMGENKLRRRLLYMWWVCNKSLLAYLNISGANSGNVVETPPKILLSIWVAVSRDESCFCNQGQKCYLVHLKMLSLSPAFKGQSKSVKCSFPVTVACNGRIFSLYQPVCSS